MNHDGGIGNEMGELFLIDSTVRDNDGNLTAVSNGSDGRAVIQGSTISGNQTGTHAAVSNAGSLTILNATVSGNSADGLGALGGSLSLAYTTITGNAGFGLLPRGTEMVSFISNSLIAGNGNKDCGPPFSTFPASAIGGRDIDSDGTCGSFTTQSMDALQLGPLADNGGPTWTHALLPGSVAIDDAMGSCPANDQRGVERPAGRACDGALTRRR